MNKAKSLKSFWKEGEPQVWATGAALTIILLIMFVLLFVVLRNGMATFWPSDVALLQLEDGSQFLGEEVQRQERPKKRVQIKVGNRDLYGMDFRWIEREKIKNRSYPEEVVVLERMEYGNFIGYFKGLSDGRKGWEAFEERFEKIKEEEEKLEELSHRISHISYSLERIRLKLNGVDPKSVKAIELKKKQHKEREELEGVVAKKDALTSHLEKERALFEDASGRSKEIILLHIVRFSKPNAMGVGQKSFHYLCKIGELLFGEPRESNTEGGLYPAIFGTVIMVFIMSLFAVPLGVLAALYLSEYAGEGMMVRIVRIAVNNLAGIPSIVYGVFGLGFFVYGIGGTLDHLIFSDKLPTPTFGTGGILWASLTLSLLTVPVVIIATEEGLSAIPRGIREASFSLGATKFQTITRVLLPMASPGIMTGLILAMARAAGEVAPLMITGVVKLAPALPIDGNFPFLHLDRKFMHLGFHIFDIGFQSPNVEAAKPMVFVTTLLLLLIVIIMSSSAIYLRNRMKKRYTVKTF